MLIYGVDIGGSSIKHAIVRTGTASPVIVERRQEIPVESRLFRDLRDAVLEAVASTTREHPDVAAVAISTTGTVSPEGVVLNAGHFEDYRSVNWRALILSAEPRVRDVTTVNDGRAATWAEYSLKASECDHFSHFVVGTGIGGASVVRGELVVGDEGNAGNFGHLRVTSDRTIRCSCGNHGCLEAVASSPAIVADYRRREAERGGSVQQSVIFRDVVERARADDQSALAALRTAGEWLGVGLGIAINVFNPRYVTVGGGVLLAAATLHDHPSGNVFFESAIATALATAHRRPAQAVRISHAAYGNDGGIIGAALLAAASARS